KAQVITVANAMVRLHALTARVAQLHAELASHLAHAGEQQHDLGFFKKIVAMELKRGKRHQYPLALLMVALDGLEQRMVPDEVMAAIRAELIGTVSPLLRDIDL